jgi:hypothetical protein
MNSRKFTLTKKKIILILIASIVFLGIGMKMSPALLHKTKSSSEATLTYLTYLSIRGTSRDIFPAISLSPVTSDQVDNQSILNALISTLVKYGSSGKIEPYLASDWQVSEGDRKWTFNLRSGFTCESGEELTAESFHKSLLENFRRNLQKSDKTEFSHLKGWADFTGNRTNSPSGLSFEGNRIIFDFDLAVPDLLNYLRMPYFGFWCKENFSEGEFQSQNKFVSSGPYKIVKALADYRLQLSMRQDQPSYSAEAPQFIEIGYGSIDEVKADDKSKIAKIIYEDSPPEVETFTAIDGPPLILQGLALNTRLNFFKNKKNRMVFAKRLNEFKNQNLEHRFSKGFFLTSEIIASAFEGVPSEYETTDSEIRLAVQYDPSTLATKQLWENLFAYVLKGQKYKVFYPQKGDSSWVKNILNSDEYELRTTSVYPGAHYVVSVINMMFCTKLGISYPDPSGRMCELVSEYTAKEKPADKKFEQEFNKILVEDSAVFPLFHARDRWLISSDIDLDTMPTSIIHPLFEKIRFK